MRHPFLTAPINWLNETKLAIADAEEAQPMTTPLTWRDAPATRLAWGVVTRHFPNLKGVTSSRPDRIHDPATWTSIPSGSWK
jgi:hypothetical protein